MSVAAGNSGWPIPTSVAAVQLGTSRRALDAVADLVRAKAGKAGSVLLIDNAHVQRLLMGAEAALPVPLVIWLLGGQGNSLTAGGIGSLDTVVMSRMPEGRGVCLAAL